MEKPYMIEQVIKFSDGTETVIKYKPNPLGATEIETKVAEAVEGDHRVSSEVTASEPVEVIESEVTSSEMADAVSVSEEEAEEVEESEEAEEVEESEEEVEE